MAERGTFQLHLPGLLKVLAEHLYSSQRVGVRELLQNAHDSCVRRSVEQWEASYRPRIDLSIDARAKVLRVSDNGSGLTTQEIQTYLTVIGRGYTRELRERLAAEDADRSQLLVGQFGIGFLAAYLLASEVTVETLSANSAALRWRSIGDDGYELDAGSRERQGTTVELKLKPSANFLLRESLLTDTVREYADFLPTPVFVADSAAPANLGSPPWEQSDPESACRAYAARRFGESEPLCVLQLRDGKVNLGHDTVTVPLRGFLFIPAQSVVSVKEYGTAAVYIRHMAICDADKDLLPDWARFVRGVIDCPALQPTASREAVHQDDAFEALRQILAEQLGAGLRRIAREEPQAWRQVVFAHTDLIMGWAAKDDDFFRLVADSVPLRTSRGRIAFPEYLQASGGGIYYTTRELGSLQEKILAEGRDLPAIDASWFGVQEFLKRYAAIKNGLPMIRLDDDLGRLLQPVTPGPYQELLTLCEELGFNTRAASFKPADFPAVMTYPAGAEFVRDATSALNQGLIPDGFSSFLHEYVSQKQASTPAHGTLHLNISCPLIQRLAAAEVPVARKQAALATIAFFARLFCGRMLDASQATTDLASWRKSLERLVLP
ncbi:MAG TPA: ATP-binding protein [Phycisphaerae bacterium]|nr:ATP-binding protein [Phycisphaerae bacterium]